MQIPIRIEPIAGNAYLAKTGDPLPLRADGATSTTLRDSIFSTVPGTPAYVGKASYNRVNLPEFGMVWSFEGRNAIQADYRITFSEPR